MDDALSSEVCSDPLWWREVFLLAIIEQKKTPRVAVRYIKDLLEYDNQNSNDNQHRLWILCGLALMELSLQQSDKLIQRVSDGLVKLIENRTALNVSERAEAGRVVAGIGDNRGGVGITNENLPDIDWIAIPGGNITLEDDAGTFAVEAFHLARYPVTNAQFDCFIKDPQDYTNPRWWQNLDSEPGSPSLPRWPEANHPRETVSWSEAMAFCAWLSDRLGKTICLPTEWQWQQAACSGQSDFTYPWGPEYKTGFANIYETWDAAGSYYLGRTTAVGLYPQGNSRQGVSDLSGNVWEWCLNEYDTPGNTQSSGNAARVLRGGARGNDPDGAHASYRDGGSPDDRDDYLGFRLCCLSPI